MKPNEKRRAPRVRHDSVVEILDASGTILIGTARLVDFSKVGLCIAGSLAVSPGDAVHARVRLLREGILEIVGRVVWLRKKPTGCQYGISAESTRQTPR